LVIAAALALGTLLAWVALARTGAAMNAMPGMDASPWTARELGGALAMWLLMIPAMMLPVASRVVQAHAAASRRHRGEDALARSGAFVGGYLAVWVPCAALAALAQWALHAGALHGGALHGGAGPGTGDGLTAALLLAAGGFQLAPFKHACLERCRTPLGFLLTEWRPRWRGALVMGVRHGGTCVACCWAIMAVMLATGAMNLAWMAALTLLTLGEQLAPRGHRLARAAGVGMMGWGAWLLLGAVA
jgi:predicted metal-binding membrane protein